MSNLRHFVILLLTLILSPSYATAMEAVTLQLKWQHQFQFAGYYAAKANGYYAEEGLDVTLRERTPDINVIDEVVEGRAEFGVAGMGLLSRYQQGAPIRALAAIFQHDALVILSKAESGIISPYELAGTTLMFDSSTGNDAVIQALLQTADLDLNDLKTIPRDFNLDHFIDNKVDAVVAYITNEPHLLRNLGINTNVISPHSYGIDFYGDTLFTSDQQIQQNPERVERFRRASLKGWHYALAHPDEIIQLIKTEYHSESSIEQLEYEARETRKLILPERIELGTIQAGRLQHIVEVYQQNNPNFHINDIQLQSFVYQPSTQIHLSSKEKEWLAQHPIIKVGIDNDFAPYEWINEDGKYVGVAAEYIRLLEEKLGIRFQIIGEHTWAETLDMAYHDEVHMLACLNASPERSQHLNFTEPYINNPIVIVNADRYGYIGSLSALAGKKVSVERGYFTAETIASEFPEIELILTDNTESALRLVATGEADAYVGDAAYANFAIKQANLLHLQFSGTTTMRSSYRMGVSKAQPELLSIINKVFTQISAAEHDHIRQHWLGLTVTTGPSSELIARTIIISVSILLLFAWWIYRLRRSKKDLLVSQARLKTIIDASPIPHLLCDDKQAIIYFNQAFEDNFGYKLEDIPTMKEWWQLSCPQSSYRQHIIQQWHQSLHQPTAPAQAPEPVEVEIYCRSGEQRHILMNAAAVETNLSPKISVTILYDISERKQFEERLKMSGRVFNQSHEGILITNADGHIVDVNPAFTDITGYSREEVIGQKSNMLRSGKQSQSFYKDIWLSLKEKGYWHGELWDQRKSGEEFAQKLTISALFDEAGETKHYLGMFSDVTQTIQQQKALELMAHYDVLTQLPNRSLFADRFKLAIAHSKRNQSILAIVFLDLDGFKPINDQYGHDTGDKILIQVAQRLQSSIREDDTASRLGGDEFVLLLNDIHSPNHCNHLINRIRHSLELPFTIDNETIKLSASLGITLYPEDDADVDTLLRHADQAMYQAKMAGRGRHAYFDTRQDQQLSQQHEQLNHIQQAMLNHQFLLHFQPKVDMRSGEVIGAEALIRWQHPEKGLIPPAQFLPIIQGTELEIQVGNWVLEQTISQIEKWLIQNITIEVSVNMSSQHLQWPGLLEHLERIFQRHPSVSPRLLQLEILESSVLSDINSISNIIHTCRNVLGIRIALDDFGTGYSSLTHLRHLPVDIVKIDRSFVADIIDDPDDFTIVDGVIGLTESFHHQVLAEGVETDAQGLILMTMGCYLAQGFGIARPMAAADFDSWYQNYQANPVWLAYASQEHSMEQSIAQQMSIQSQYWAQSILELVASGSSGVKHWPSTNQKKNHFNLWLEHANKHQLFTAEWLNAVTVVYEALIQQANSMKYHYQENQHAQSPTLTDFQQQLSKLESLLEQYLPS